MQFTEVKVRLSGERLEYSCLLLEQTTDRLVLRYDLPHSGQIARLSLPAGSICLAYYWIQHPYNVYHWVDHTGKTLAFYVNLSGPTFIARDHVEWTDLVVDVLIVPDETLGDRVDVLDEDEIPQDLDEATREHIDAALDEVMSSWPSMVRSVTAHSKRLLGIEADRR